MKSLNHSKYKNTRILFELLTRQITVDILNERSQSEAIDMLKRYFGGGTELAKEHDLYKTLLSENFKSEERAEELLDEVIERRKKLNDKEISDQKYNLVGEIKENYSLDDFFQSRIDNYREYASIYKVFSYFNDDKNYDPADAIRSKDTILEHITDSKGESVNEDDQEKNDGELSKVLENYRDQSKDLRLLTQKLLIEKFNERYDSLLPEQKKLLKKYINNVSNTNNLREYVNNEVDRVRNELREYIKDIDAESTRIKVRETINLSEDLKKGNYVRDNQVSTLMMYYQLLDEVKENVE